MASIPNSIADSVASLAHLKKMLLEQKALLLLARLAHIGRHDQNALHKGNLMLAGDPYALAQGFSDAEKQAIREHLLGAPWTKLVNEGYLVDVTGQGFYKISEEGHDFLNAASTTEESPSVATTISTGAPQAFLSYSWDGPAHQSWVSGLAERLQEESGVKIIFDQWYLNPGDDKLRFMEQSVAASDFVIVVCTPNYAERANKREGGVGYESMVITAQLAEHMHTNKFIPVLRDGTFSSALPLYLKSRLGVDLREIPYSEAEYEKLARVLHGEPIQPPPLGKKPEFAARTPTEAPRSGAPRGEAVSLLGPPQKRPAAFAHARYDKPGVAGPWPAAHARKWELNGETKYSFETSQGDEFMGTKDEVSDRFFAFHRNMLKDGYIRMNFSPGPDPDFYVLT